MKIIDKTAFSISSLLVTFPLLATQAVYGVDDPATIEPPTLSGVGDILDRVVALVFPVAGIVCVVFIIIGGYMWMISAGDPSKAKQAQGTLTWAVIGLVVVMLAAAIVTLITRVVE